MRELQRIDLSIAAMHGQLSIQTARTLLRYGTQSKYGRGCKNLGKAKYLTQR